MTHDDEEQGARTPDPAGTPEHSTGLTAETSAPPASSESYTSIAPEVTEAPPKAVTKASAPPPPPPPPSSPADNDEEDHEEDGMLRMSFLEHLEELRSRILRALGGVGVAFLFCIIFAEKLWVVVSEPATQALITLGIKDPKLAQLTPMEAFSTIWVKLPMLASIFVASPWILYQVWAFIAPGLYKKERRWAAPFVICSAGLFILGGLFAYFIAFRFALTFLLKIGKDAGIRPYIGPTEYMDLFINVVLGVALILEMPVLIFFLTLLRVVSPKFLLKHARYAILGITIVAAIITPTPDAVTMTLVATPMILLYFVGVFASYLLVLRREKRAFPWKRLIKPALYLIVLCAVAVIVAMNAFHLHWVWKWPFLMK